jgi:hypothetical protein
MNRRNGKGCKTVNSRAKSYENNNGKISNLSIEIKEE